MSLLKTFALDPAVVTDCTTLAVLVSGLGTEHGRLLAEFPRAWRRFAIEHSRQITSSRDRLRVEALLQRLALEQPLKTRVSVPYDGSTTWQVNAVRNASAFDGVLLSESSAPSVGAAINVHRASDVLGAPDFWSAERHHEFNSTAAGFAALLGPLLALEKTVTAFDPFFNPAADRFTRATRAILDAMPQGGRLTLHASAATQPGSVHVPSAEWDAAVRNQLGPLLHDGRELVVARWEPGQQGGRPHERWILNARAGIILDRGLGVDGTPNSATLMSLDQIASLRAEYSEPPFSSRAFALYDVVKIP